MIDRRAVVAVLAGCSVVIAACSDETSPQASTSQSSAESAPGSTVPFGSLGSAVVYPLDTASPTSVAPAVTTPIVTTPAVTVLETTVAATQPPAVGNPVVAAELIVTLAAPVGLAVRPGDTSLYVIEQGGRVVRVDRIDPGSPATTQTVADVSDRVSAGGERGLLGIAFAADGASAWLNYTDTTGSTVVAEYPVALDGTFDIDAERALLTIGQPYANHNGGDLALGPDGMLYVAMGDGGSAGDPQRHANNPMSLLGKLLRIDPAPSSELPYTIPADNPFAGGDLNGVGGAPEVWSWGLRNPWKIAFDSVTNELWVADVGQNQFEEVNLVRPTDRPAGWSSDFGWSGFEGYARYNDDVADPGSTVLPVLTYEHGADGCSISGGAVYRGAAIAELTPAYVYGDFCSGLVWALDLAGGRNLTLAQFEQVTAVRAGPDGELYVLEATGNVSRLVPG